MTWTVHPSYLTSLSDKLVAIYSGFSNPARQRRHILDLWAGISTLQGQYPFPIFSQHRNVARKYGRTASNPAGSHTDGFLLRTN